MISRLPPGGSRKEFLGKKDSQGFRKNWVCFLSWRGRNDWKLGQRPALVSKSLLKFPYWRFERGKSLGLVSLFVPGPAAVSIADSLSRPLLFFGTCQLRALPWGFSFLVFLACLRFERLLWSRFVLLGQVRLLTVWPVLLVVGVLLELVA